MGFPHRRYCQFHKDDEGQDVGAFAVFDGHGGPVAAKFVRDHLFKNLLGHEHFGRNLAKAVEDAYQVGAATCRVFVSD